MQNAARPKQRSMRRLSALCLTLCLAASSSGCASFGQIAEHFAPTPAEPVVIARCPPRRAYEKATVTKSADELRGLLKADPTAATPDLIHDYRTLRQACDAIEKK